MDIEKFPFHNKSKNTFRPECRECYNKLRRERTISDENFKRKRQERNRRSYYKYLEKRKEKVKQYQKDPKNKEKIYKWSQNSKIKRRQIFKEYKETLKCSNCDENHISCLEFHHIDPKTKEGLVTKMVYSTNKLQKEIEKCIVLCSNCHRKLHYNLNNKNT